MSELTLEDRAAIQDLLIRYAAAIDTRDWTLLRTCFTPDCQTDYGQFGAWNNVEDLCAAMDVAHQPVGPSQHRLSNIALTADGDGARSKSYVDVIILTKDEGRPIRAYGWYEDGLVREGGRWLFKTRRYGTMHAEGGK